MSNKIYIIAPLLAVVLFYTGNYIKFSVPAPYVEKLRAGSTQNIRENKCA